MTELQKHQTAEILIGGVAQLGERLLCKQEVIGSNPFTSTTVATRLRPGDRRCVSHAESTGKAAPRGTTGATAKAVVAAQGRARGSEKIATPPQTIAAGLIEG